MLFEQFKDGRYLSWIKERNDFSNLESPCRPNASQQVWAQSNLAFGGRCDLKIFNMVTVAAILDIGTQRL